MRGVIGEIGVRVTGVCLVPGMANPSGLVVWYEEAEGRKCKGTAGGSARRDQNAEAASERMTGGGLHAFCGDAQSFQRFHGEAAARKLILDRGMRSRHARAAVDHVAVSCDCLAKALGGVQRRAGLAQKLAAGGIRDRVLALDFVPQCPAVRTERTRRLEGDGSIRNHRKRRFFGHFCHAEPPGTSKSPEKWAFLQCFTA